MSELTELLEEIFEWLQQNYPSFTSELKPGINRSRIDYLLEGYPLRFPSELYELYQWHNGLYDDNVSGQTDSYFLFMWAGFNSLEGGLSTYQKFMRFRQESGDPRLWDELWFPTFSYSNKGHLIIICDGQEQNKPIFEWYLDDVWEPRLKYISITAMMKTALECYQTGVYGLDEYGDFIEIDYEQQDTIRRKHNPGTSSFL